MSYIGGEGKVCPFIFLGQDTLIYDVRCMMYDFGCAVFVTHPCPSLEGSYAASLRFFLSPALYLLFFIANMIYISYRLKALDTACPSMDDAK